MGKIGILVKVGKH